MVLERTEDIPPGQEELSRAHWYAVPTDEEMSPGNRNRLVQDCLPDLAAEKAAVLEKGSAICHSRREGFQLPVVHEGKDFGRTQFIVPLLNLTAWR